MRAPERPRPEAVWADTFGSALNVAAMRSTLIPIGQGVAHRMGRLPSIRLQPVVLSCPLRCRAYRSRCHRTNVLARGVDQEPAYSIPNPRVLCRPTTRVFAGQTR
jgi:hypothetical protein